MQQLILKAVTTAADEGTFQAVISTASVDREKDIVDPAGFVRALQKWVPTGKKIPLAWNHSTKAEDQIGYVDPASAREQDGEVVASGWIDQSTPNGEHAWRMVKAGTLGFSFGYLTLDGEPRKGGGTHIKELDVFEVSATGTPMNADTRVLGYKGPATGVMADCLSSMIDLAGQYIAAADDQEDADEMQSILGDLQELVSDTDDVADQAEDAAKNLPPAGQAAEAQEPESQKAVDTDKEPRARSVDSLIAQADAVALEVMSGGESLKKPPRPAQKAPAPPIPSEKELRERCRAEMLTVLSGGLES